MTAIALIQALDDLVDLVDGSWAYPAVLLIAFLDAFFPLVPSETMVVAAGVLASSGKLELWLIIVVAAVGAILGDHVSYVIGRTVGHRYQHVLFRGKREKSLLWAERTLQTRGPYLIVIARFIPGGRTVTTFAAGLLRYPLRRFTPWDIVAGAIWGTYGALIGYFGGKAFEESPSKGILLALGIAFGIAATIEGTRYLRKRRAGDLEGADPAE